MYLISLKYDEITNLFIFNLLKHKFDNGILVANYGIFFLFTFGFHCANLYVSMMCI